MTNLSLRSVDIPRPFGLDFPQIQRFGIGFDSMFDELMRINERDTGNYPPYNIVKRGADQFSIELAVAGFKEGDIEVTLEKNQLTINGKQAVQLSEGKDEYLFRGISSKNFTRVFTLAEHVSVIGAETTDGILTIQLERKIPEEAKSKKIPISYTR